MTLWYDEPATMINGPGLSMIIVPGRGGKIVSLRDGDGVEWLLGPPDPLPPPARPGDAFEAAEMCGWDECAPTIDAGRLADGTEVPDHGDLWTATWSVGDGTIMEAAGSSLPYGFRRAVLSTATGLELRYRVTADRELPFLWAAHPQFLAPPGTMIELPAGIERVIDVYPEQGTERRWTAAAAMIDSVPPGTGRKVYLSPADAVGTVALQRPDGRGLRLSWDPARLPYLGLWYDRHAVARADVIAPEPCTGYYDSLAAAVERGQVATVAPDRPLEWSLFLESGRG
ncbi:hypothetical protein [Microlunatus sp. GCM10028923]|uniref:hypothetical protein n=1 Tax=Microlunatus sp. GCM10028923 TaxID=3273400 RepID=UPI00360A2297